MITKFILLVIVFSSLSSLAYADINLKLDPINGPVIGPYIDNAVTISLSTSCERLVLVNSTICPSYDFFLDNQLDNSRSQSGTFKIIDGILKRDQNNLANEEMLYSFDKYPLIIDPSQRLQLKLKTIYIVPSLENYLTIEDKKKTNDTRTVHKERFIDKDCRTATISGKTFLKTIADTIYQLRNNCTKTSLIKEFDVITDNKTVIDITTTSEYKYQLWLKESLKKSKSQFLIK